MMEDVCMIDSSVSYFFDALFSVDPLTPLLNLSTIDVASSPSSTNDSCSSFSDLSSPIRPQPHLELKQLPSDLKYAFLDSESQFSVIIASDLSPQQKKLGALLRNHKSAISWSLDDIHGISLFMCTHRIHLEDPVKTSREPRRSLNPILKKAVRTEILKLLDVSIIYPISDSNWVTEYTWSLKKICNYASRKQL